MSGLVHLGDLVRAHCSPEGFAADVTTRTYRIAGVDAEECSCGCGRVIEFVEFDIGGADPVQPQGFVCKPCDEWTANECGDRAARECNGCKAAA